MAKSLAEQLAELPDDERNAILAELDQESLLWDWSFFGRPEQQAPPGDWAVWAYIAGRGSGKLLAMDTPMRYHDAEGGGWKPIGEIQTGDQIFDENGRLCTVTQAHTPEVPTRMYRLTFSDGTTLEAGEEHQWVTWTHAERKSYCRSDSRGMININDVTSGYPENWPTWTRYDRWGHDKKSGPKIRTTQEISDTFRHGKRGDLNHSIPLTRPLRSYSPLSQRTLDPYLLGAWLGDGSTASGEFSVHGDDKPQLIEAILKAGYTVGSNKKDERSLNGWRVNALGLITTLKAMGLHGHKHIPTAYLNAPISVRRELLAGLIDTDGTLSSENGIAEYCTVLPELADNVLELVRSLGEKPTLKQSDSYLYGERKKDRYRITWRPLENPARLERKRAKFVAPGKQTTRTHQRMITGIEEITPVLSRCLTVDSPNSMYLAGKALIPTHNTRTASEWVREQAKYTTTGERRFALVARTAADVRDVIIEGASGILNVTPPSERPLYEPSKRRLTWPNGNIAIAFTADEPDSLRGPEFSHAWGDEVAAWRQTPDGAGMTAWDNLRVATRLGANPQILVTTTPKRVPLLYSLIEESKKNPDRAVITRGSTLDNASNLAGVYLENLLGVYDGTSLARQEIYGEMLDVMDGAVWTEELIDKTRQLLMPVHAPLRIIGVDPSVAENPRDYCGIVVCASTADRDLYKRQAWVLEDASILGAPNVWAQKVVEMANKWGCPVVAETNQGGALVGNAIRQIDPSVVVLDVHSKYGKALRAEPISLAYDQERVHHVGYLDELEKQMTTWIPGEGKSPDRVDALVHALTALLIKPPTGFTGGAVTARSYAGRRLETVSPARAAANSNNRRTFRVR